jgi:hypothetical protein
VRPRDNGDEDATTTEKARRRDELTTTALTSHLQAVAFDRRGRAPEVLVDQVDAKVERAWLQREAAMSDDLRKPIDQDRAHRWVEVAVRHAVVMQKREAERELPRE